MSRSKSTSVDVKKRPMRVADGIECLTAHEVHPADDGLGPDRAFGECKHLHVVAHVDRDGAWAMYFVRLVLGS